MFHGFSYIKLLIFKYIKQMRTILFRAKDINSKDWIYGVPNYDFRYLFNEDNLDSFNNYEVLPKTIGQFIGINDIKGKKIFEGDILRVGENLTCEIIYIEKNVEDYGDEIHSAFHAKVMKHNKTIPLDSYLKNNCVVVGNIHDNQDLLQ